MKIREMSRSASLLAIVYLLYVIGIVFSVFGGGISVVQIVLTAFSIITLLAIATDVGNWARIFGLIYGCVLITFGIGAIFSSEWGDLPDMGADSILIYVGIALIGLGVWTILVLRRKPPVSEEPAL